MKEGMGKYVETCGQIAHGVSVFVEKYKHTLLNKQILHSTPKNILRISDCM